VVCDARGVVLVVGRDKSRNRRTAPALSRCRDAQTRDRHAPDLELRATSPLRSFEASCAMRRAFPDTTIFTSVALGRTLRAASRATFAAGGPLSASHA